MLKRKTKVKNLKKKEMNAHTQTNKTIGWQRTTRGASSIQSTTTSIAQNAWILEQKNILKTMYELECLYSTNQKSETLKWIRWYCIGNKGTTRKKHDTFFYTAQAQSIATKISKKITKGNAYLRCLLFVTITFIINIIRDSAHRDRDSMGAKWYDKSRNSHVF